MSRSLLRTAAWALVVAIVIVLAATTGSAVAHDLQHAAHHGAGLHSTGICAWMCAAGQALGEIPAVFQIDRVPLRFRSLPTFQEPLEIACRAPGSRGPPALSIS
ncbi:MAG: hypothetical protein AB1555_02400 [Nitrospirota bacterium]